MAVRANPERRHFLLAVAEAHLEEAPVNLRHLPVAVEVHLEEVVLDNPPALPVEAQECRVVLAVPECLVGQARAVRPRTPIRHHSARTQTAIKRPRSIPST